MRQTKEEKIHLLKQQISNFKAAIRNPETFEYQIFGSSAPKKDRIRAWAAALEELHDLGEFAQPVNTISSYISEEIRLLGKPNAVPYVREVLSNKYKNDHNVHGDTLLRYELNRINEDKLREKLKKEELYHRQNQRYIDHLTEDAKSLLSFAKKLETTEFVALLDPDVLDEHFTAKTQGRKLIEQMTDGRTSVIPEKLHMLVHGYTQGTKAHAFSEYVKILLKTATITPKQTGRLLTGRVTQIETLYEPTDMAEARHRGFWGTTCDECGSWRVDKRFDTDMNSNRLFCFACKIWGDIRREVLVDKEIQ